MKESTAREIATRTLPLKTQPYGSRILIVDANDFPVAQCYTQDEADLLIAAVNAYQPMVDALRKSEQRINQLCSTVNTLSNKFGLGNKVHAEDFADVARDALALTQDAAETAGRL